MARHVRPGRKSEEVHCRPVRIPVRASVSTHVCIVHNHFTEVYQTATQKGIVEQDTRGTTRPADTTFLVLLQQQ